MGRLLYILAPGNDRLYQEIVGTFGDTDAVHVVVDRRLGERRRAVITEPVGERRRADRRQRATVDSALQTVGWALVRLP